MTRHTDSSNQPSQLDRALDALRAMRRRVEDLQRSRTEPIAVVGIGCRFPGAPDGPESFWELLRAGTDAVTEVPAGRWDMDACYDPEPDTPGKMCSRHGGFLESIDRFDAEFFGIAPREAASMDPQHRLVLEVAWESLEHAGLAPASLVGQNAGVFVGISANDYLRLQARNAREGFEGHTLTGNALNAVAGRLSFFLGLHGPSMAVDTACSSSLVAVHLACQSLRIGECRLALAGGVNAVLSPDMSIIASRARMLSPDGRCKTFDASADGFVRSEGCGILVLKKLSDAQAHGDRVLAVIRGSAVNQDGPGSGFTTPNGLAQQQLIGDALANAGIEPARVGYVEAHGTGTALGDPIEARAIGQVYAAQRPADRPLVIGSVKTNIGHLESAAGVAGLIKTVLALQNRQIPPHLHLRRINPEIRLDDIPAIIPTRLLAWQTADGPRIAGVSSFGASGTNAHLIVEEPPPIEAKRIDPPLGPHLLCLSARTESALREIVRRYLTYFHKHPDVPFGDVCFTAGVGRCHFSHRLAVLADSIAQARDRLAAFIKGVETEGLICGNCRTDLASVRRPVCGEPGNRIETLGAMARAYVDGAEIDWNAVATDAPYQRVSLPTYPFERKRFWFEPGPSLPRESIHRVRDVHPLLGGRLSSNPSETRFESTLSPAQPDYLADHRVAGAVLFPATAYLEMALAAQARTQITPTRELRNVSFSSPLILFPKANTTVYTVIITNENEKSSFEILSLLDPEFSDPSAPDRHAAGILQAVSARAERPGRTSVDTLRQRCPRSVPAETYYRRLDEAGLSFGPSFRGITELWVGDGETLAKINPTGSSPAVSDPYQFHPALLDACFQAVGPLIENGRLWPDALYVAAGLDRFRLFHRPCGPLYSRAVCRNVKTIGKAEQAIFDVTVLSESGHVIAEIQGLKLHRTDAYQEHAVADIDDLLYEVRWQRLTDPAPTCTASPSRISEQVESQLSASRARGEMSVYNKVIPRMDALCVSYAVEALRDLGCTFRPGLRFATDTLADQLAVVPRYHRLLARLLKMLAASGVLRPVENEWEVRRQPDPTDPATQSARLMGEYPACAPELRLLSRCGPRLADVLRGRCDPLDLLFPDGSLTDLEGLYREAPFARVGNRILRETVQRILSDWPSDRNIRILEIGAGTGGTTRALLDILPADRTAYRFTDLAPLFLSHAGRRFASYPFLRYERFDVERDPIEQGFEQGDFDVVIAANVLHATSDLRITLAHVHRLLSPGGSILLLEVTAPQHWADLTFGLTDGWWKFTDTHLRHDYPLMSRDHWLSLLRETGFVEPAAIESAEHSENPFKQSVLLARVGQDAQASAITRSDQARWLIFADRAGIGAALANRLRGQGCKPILIHAADRCEQTDPDNWQCRPHHPEDVARVLQADRGPSLRSVVHLWSLDSPMWETDSPPDANEHLAAGCQEALYLTQTLAGSQPNQTARLWFVTRGAQSVTAAADVCCPNQAALWGLGRVVATEHPEFWGGLIDLDPTSGVPEAADDLLRALRNSDREDQVAFRGGHRHAPRLTPVSASAQSTPAPGFHADATYLITGGLAGLGLAVAQWIVDRGGRHLALMARGEPSLAARNVIDELESTGAKIRVILGDVSRPTDVAAALAEISASMPPLRGVIHAAGVLDDGVLTNQTWQRFETVLAPKVTGTWRLHEQTAGLPLDFFVMFSSAASLLGSAGQGNHAAANAFIDALAAYRRSRSLPAATINWGAWGNVGTVVEKDVARQFARQGIDIIAPRRMLAALEWILEQKRTHTCVLALDWPTYLRQFASAAPPSLFRMLEHNPPAALEHAARPERNAFFVDPADATPIKRREALTAHLREQVTSVLGLEPSGSIELDRPLSELGLDSLLAIELRKNLGSTLRHTLPATILFDCPTIEALRQYVSEKILGWERADEASLETQQREQEWARRAERLQAMAERDLEKLLLEKVNAVKERWIE